EDSIALASKIGTTFLLGQAKSFLAACRLADGAVQEARALCAEANALAENTGDKFTQGLALRISGDALCAQARANELAPAKQALLDAIRIQEAIGAKPELARSYERLAGIASMAGDSTEALRRHH